MTFFQSEEPKNEQLGSVTYLPPKLRYLNLPLMELLKLQKGRVLLLLRIPYKVQINKSMQHEVSEDEPILIAVLHITEMVALGMFRIFLFFASKV